MDPKKKSKLEAAGWVETTVEEFLGMTPIPTRCKWQRKVRVCRRSKIDRYIRWMWRNA